MASKFNPRLDRRPPKEAQHNDGAIMTASQWLELTQLAEALCPDVLLDLPSMTISDARGVLLWLRSQAKERMP